MDSSTFDEVKPISSYPHTGIDVLIVGTGLGGLSAALECHRKGHNVRILERNATINTAGNMYFMGLSATRFFKHWPEMKNEFDSISLHDAYIEIFKHRGEVMVKPMRASARLKAQGLDPKAPPGIFQIRPLVYQMFVNQVRKLGLPLEFDSRVVDYFEEGDKGGVVTEDGRKYTPDIVIAADGVSSKSQKIVGGQVRAVSSGRAMWRAAFPIENLDQDPEVKEFFHMIDGKHPIVRTWLGQSTYGLTLTRPDTMTWIINHDATGSEQESWNHAIEAEEVLEGMEKVPGPNKWAPTFKRLVKCTPPKTILNFELFWRNPQPSWTSPNARVVQIGDTSGKGATQAIEDAVSLATCLMLGGKDRIAEAVRFVRTSCAQKLGFANAYLLQETDWDKVKLDPRKAAPKLPKWVFSHDPELYAFENFEKAVDANTKDVPEGEDGVPPNYPAGFKYEPWTIDQIIEDKRAGRETELGSGDWE